MMKKPRDSFDAGAQAQPDCPREVSLATAIQLNTKGQKDLAQAIKEEFQKLIERMALHEQRMEELRRRQALEVDRQLTANGQTCREMELGRHALNSNTEAVQLLVKLLEAM